MCTFEYKILLCGCESPNCKQRTKNFLHDNLKNFGHILRITQVLRVSGVCMDWFNNTDPDRFVVRWGFPSDNRNSTQDCAGEKKFLFNKDRPRGHFCEACLKGCEQPRTVQRLLAMKGKSAREERIRRGLEAKPEEDMMAVYNTAMESKGRSWKMMGK